MHQDNNASYFVGLVLHRGRLLYGYRHGLRLPEAVMDMLVTSWNRVACYFWGHDDTLWHLWVGGYPTEPLCSYCMAELTRCVGGHEKGKM